MDSADGRFMKEDESVAIFDSGTSSSEALLGACAKLSAEGKDIGGRPAPKFNIRQGGKSLTIGSNVDSHYLVVQGYMRDAIWRSTWLVDKGIDVIWTFGLARGDKPDETPILGPQLAGKALTALIPKWFNYVVRLVTIPVPEGQPRHVLYTQAHSELSGMGMSFGNARHPLRATTQMPPEIEPASLIRYFEIVNQAKQESLLAYKAEVGINE